MNAQIRLVCLASLLSALGTLGCGGDEDEATNPATGGGNSTGGNSSSGGSSATGGSNGSGGDNGSGGSAGSTPIENPLTDPESGPPAGNPDGMCDVPAEAGPEDVSTPKTVVGTGSADSCTGQAFVDAVAQGGVITFDCGPDPVTITLDQTAKVFNDASDNVVIDGGGKVTLSGGGAVRILYMNTCDEAQHYTTDHCDNQEYPHLTVQNITFIDAYAGGQTILTDGGGAIWVRGGRFKAVNTRFFNNECVDSGPEVGGAGIRVFSQYENLPVYVVNSTFGGAEGLGNKCANGGGVSSIGVNWTIINSLFSYNEAIDPAYIVDGPPAGGAGGAIYADGGTMTMSLCGTKIENNAVNAFGSAIFFISNNHEGTLQIEDSVIRNNTGGSWYELPGISMHDSTVEIIDEDSILE